MISPRIGSRLDGKKTVAALSISQRSPASAEIRIERRIVLIVSVPVTARRVRLPQFHKRSAHRLPVFIENASAHHDSLACRSSCVLRSQVRISGPHRGMAKYRSRPLG